MKSVLAKSIGLFVCLGMTGCAPASGPVTKPVAWVLDDGLCEPETVILAPNQDELIVSNICGFKKNGAGYLSRISLDGEMIEARWVEGLDAPAGMVRSQTTLFVVDIDRIHIIEIETGVVQGTLGQFEGAKAFNDIAKTHDDVLYVSDSARGQALKIENGEATPFPNPESKFEYANGMHTQAGKLYVGGTKLWEVDLVSEEIKEISVTGLSDIDGIEGDGSGGLSVSVVGGNVWHLPTQGRPQELTAEGVSSTNHAYLPLKSLIIVPTGYDNTIVAFRP